MAPATAAGPPPPPGVADILEVTDLSGLAASPNGTGIAFRTERATIEGNTYILTWYVTEAATGRVRKVGGGGDPLYADPGLVQTERAFWSPDSTSILYRARIDGRVGLWKAAADGSGARPAVVGGADVESIEAENGGAALLYRLGPSRDLIMHEEQREYDEGILVDEHVDLAQNVFRGGSINGRMATQRLTGRWFERKGLLWRAERPRRRLDLVTMRDDELAAPAAPVGSDEAGAAGVTATSARGDVAAASWDEGKGALVVRRAGSRPPVSCEAAACAGQRIVALVWRPGEDQLLFTVQDRHQAQALWLWTVGTGEARLVARSDGLLSGGRDANLPCAVTDIAAFCVAASAVSPPRLERIDLATGARSTVFDPNAALRGLAAPVVEPLRWTGPDGQVFTGSLLLPGERPDHPLPLFLTYYRCEGYLRGGVGDEWPLQPLVAAGFAVACVNNPPIVGRYDAIATYERALGGLRRLVSDLERRGIADTGKVGMGGLSFGSEVTMWTAMHSDLLAAASIASSQPEAGYYWLNAVRGRGQPATMKQAWGLGPPDETPGRWARVSPALNARRLTAPLLLQLPEQEARYVVELYARLTNSTTPAELYVFPDEAHLKLQPRHKLATYRRNLDWFRYWLQGYVDPEPWKAEQYRRWDALARRRSQAHHARQDRSQSSIAARSRIRK